MGRVLLITLSLVLALGGWSAVCAEDGFYVISGVKRNYAPVPKTGQTAQYATGDNGDLEKGVASPTPRFTNNGNGTVTDKLTGLIWMTYANAFGQQTWANALSAANGLKSGDVGSGLTDGSKAGDWRLPNLRELQSLVDYGSDVPALPADHQFSNVQTSNPYWSSTTCAVALPTAWTVDFFGGFVSYMTKNAPTHYVWCVRGGR